MLPILRTAPAGALILVLAAALAPATAQQGGTIGVREVAGRLVAACDISSPSRRIPVNLFVEYDTPCGLQLHNRAAAPLGAETPDGRSIPLTLHFPDFEIEVERRELGDEELFEEFTKYYSAEMGENAVVGVIGSQVLERYHVTLDLGAGQIELQAPRPRSSEQPPQPEGTLSLPLSIHNDLVWLPVRYQDGEPGALALGASRYDTLVPAMEVDWRGYPAGDLPALHLGEFDLTEFVALRPGEVVQVHPDGVAGVIGIGLLESFRVEIDRVNRLAHITQTRPAQFPEADLAFFRVLVSRDPTQVEAFLEAHPETRLAPEAAELLLELLLAEGAEPEACAAAIAWVDRTTPEDLRATRAHDLMIELGNEGFVEEVLVAGELGIEGGRDDRYPNAVHRIHALMGEVLLDRGEDQRAWKHLLSAAFGLPEDGPVNLNLGRFYEGQGRYARAFSRYVQAVIKPDSGPQALEALARVQPLLAEDAPYSVELIERLTEGKVKNFGAATRYRPGEQGFGGRVALVEFFTSATYGNGDRGAIAGALGNQGLQSYFAPENAVFLTYHLPLPTPSPLCNELADTIALSMGIVSPDVQVINGLMRGPGAGRWRDAEEIFVDCRDMVIDEVGDESPYEIELEARLEGDRLTGVIEVVGPVDSNLKLNLVLAEKGVLFPGVTEVVVHRMVARAGLFEKPTGVAWRPQGEVMQLEFEASLAEIAQRNENYLDELEESGAGTVVRLSTGIDPRQVRLVAYLRDVWSGEVLQAAQVEPLLPEDEEAGEGGAR